MIAIGYRRAESRSGEATRYAIKETNQPGLDDALSRPVFYFLRDSYRVAELPCSSCFAPITAPCPVEISKAALLSPVQANPVKKPPAGDHKRPNAHETAASPRQMKDAVREGRKEVDQLFRDLILKPNVTRQTDSYPGINRQRSQSNKTASRFGLQVISVRHPPPPCLSSVYLGRL